MPNLTKVGSSISIAAIMVNNEAILKAINDLSLEKTPSVVQIAKKYNIQNIILQYHWKSQIVSNVKFYF